MNQIVDNIIIIADDRECKSEVIKSLSEKKDITVEVKRLLIGDYLADNRLVFERKTLNDFAKSIIDGRLFKQAIRLASSNYKSVLILEGTSGGSHYGKSDSGNSCFALNKSF
jgi:ERCC4-type nuclease